MTLRELAEEYYTGASELKARALELNARSREPGLCEMERFRLRCRADRLTAMWREMRGVAHYLRTYYGEAEDDIVG